MTVSFSDFINDLSAHIRARYSLIALNTAEEQRAISALENISQARASSLYVWSRTQGIFKAGVAVADVTDPLAVLKWYESLGEKSTLVLKDFHPYTKEPSVV